MVVDETSVYYVNSITSTIEKVPTAGGDKAILATTTVPAPPTDDRKGKGNGKGKGQR